MADLRPPRPESSRESIGRSGRSATSRPGSWGPITASATPTSRPTSTSLPSASTAGRASMAAFQTLLGLGRLVTSSGPSMRVGPQPLWPTPTWRALHTARVDFRGGVLEIRPQSVAAGLGEHIHAPTCALRGVGATDHSPGAGGRRCGVRWRGPKAWVGRPRRRALTGDPPLYCLAPLPLRTAPRELPGPDAPRVLQWPQATAGGISKRGDGYLRTLLIHGARSVLVHARKQQPDRLRAWAHALAQTHVHNNRDVSTHGGLHTDQLDATTLPW